MRCDIALSILPFRQLAATYAIALLMCVVANAQDTLAYYPREATLLLTPQYTTYLNATDAADSRTDYTTTFGIAYQLRFGLVLHHNWALQTGFCWSQQGQNYTAKATANSVYTYQRSFEYLKIPLTAQYRLPLSPNSLLTAEAGLQAAYLLRADFQRDAQPYLYKGGSANYTEKENYKWYDVAAVAALGMQFKANNQLFINALLRADFSLHDVDNKAQMPDYNIERSAIGVSTRAASRHLSCGLGMGIGYRF